MLLKDVELAKLNFINDRETRKYYIRVQLKLNQIFISIIPGNMAIHISIFTWNLLWDGVLILFFLA
jgi:hypothetical protein